MVALSGSNRTFFRFRKGTSESLIEEALSAMSALNQFVTGANQTVLQLEEGFKFLDLKAKLGEPQFRKLLKAHAPLAAKEILQKLSMAELVQRVPQFYDRVLSLGAEACDVLRSASDDLVVRILSETARCTTATISVLKTLVRRESKGFAPLPSPEERRACALGTLVEIAKAGQLQGWIAEVISEPDNFGVLQVRLLKTCRKRCFFLHEVKLHVEATTPDPNAAVTAADWEAIAANYVFPTADGKYVLLSNGHMESVKETAGEFARSDTDSEATEVVIRWKHALEAIKQYGLVPAVANIAGAPGTGEPDSSPSNSTPSADLIAALAAARKMKATLTEEFDACVTDDTRDLLRQKLRYVEMKIENILSQLCGGLADSEPETAIEPETAKAFEEKDLEIASLHSELEKNQSAIATLTRENLALTQQIGILQSALEQAKTQTATANALDTQPSSAAPIAPLELASDEEVEEVVEEFSQVFGSQTVVNAGIYETFKTFSKPVLQSLQHCVEILRRSSNSRNGLKKRSVGFSDEFAVEESQMPEFWEPA